jgi:NitT/TauT family transport system ATP-binding protein
MTSSIAGNLTFELSHVGKRYRTSQGTTLEALSDINLTARDGEFISIVGPSGCGKSTLLKIVIGLTAPTSGTVSFGAGGGKAAHRFGMVFQQPLLLPWRTVLRNVLLPHDITAIRTAAAAEARARELLAMLGLESFADHYPGELSGGMQQRVGIGRALMHEPSILLMDEPFGALDAMTRDQLGIDLLRIWEANRITVVFVTHSIPEAVLLADRVVVMTPRPGEIVDVLNVEIERPRTLERVNTPAFGEYVSHIRRLLDHEDSFH